MNHTPWLAALLLIALAGCSDGSSSSNDPSIPQPDPQSNNDSTGKDFIPVVIPKGDSGKYMDSFTVQTDSVKLKKVTGSTHIKGIYWDDVKEKLIYQEIKDGQATFRILDVGVTAYHPQFSPDGSKIAFSTAYEGSGAESQMYVLDLNSDAMKPIKFDDNAAIPRWHVDADGDTAIFYVTNACSNMIEAWDSTSTWSVKFSGNKFGKAEKIFDRAYNGGIAADYSFAVGGAPALKLHRAEDTSYDDRIFYNGEQVCNASLARDSSMRIMFLDAQGTPGKEYLGLSFYYFHEYIFIADTTGKIQSAIKCMDGYVFDGTEWLNVPDLFVATISPSEGDMMRRDVVIVNVATDDRIIIAHTKKDVDLMHPDVWVAP